MNTKANPRVAIWGTSPPPIGGMTVHLERLAQRLSEAEISYVMYHFSSDPHPEPKAIQVGNLFHWYFNLLFGTSPDVHYIISTRSMVRFLGVVFTLFRRKKSIIRVGGRSLQDALSRSILQRLTSQFAIRYASAFIGVNQQICDIANRYRKNQDAKHIPGFIPPSDRGQQPPSEISDFWIDRFPKIVVSGQIVDKSGFDIYGLWDVLLAVEKLKKKYPRIGLVLFSYTVGAPNSAAVNDYKLEMQRRNIQDNVAIFESETVLWPSIKQADLFLRPSYTDGDANSLREAIHLNVHCIASDVVARPKGVSTYPAGNIAAMVDSIDQGLNQDLNQDLKPSIRRQDPFRNADRIIELINSL